MNRKPWLHALIISLFLSVELQADDWKIESPLPHQVIQRTGFQPLAAHEHNPGGPALGSGEVPIAVRVKRELPATARWEFRTALNAGGYGKAVDWTPLSGKVEQGVYRASATLPAGGWYRLELRAQDGKQTLGTAAIEPVGVGELLVVAGQSYAEGANDELIRVSDPAGRVVAFDMQRSTWAVAHDPQPNAGEGGTIWPSAGDTLVPLLRVPIGFINVASGGTASRQWLPGTPLYARLAEAGKKAGRCRAVLWQQGESDVIEGIATATYVERLSQVRGSLAAAWKFEPTWLLAKSTLHPTVYNNPAGEGRIRDALEQLSHKPGFGPGPDTDILAGKNRGGPGTRRHFSGIGQRQAGLMWAIAVWNEVHRQAESRGQKR